MKTILKLSFLVVLASSTAFAQNGKVILDCKGSVGHIKQLQIQDKSSEDGAVVEIYFASAGPDSMYIQSSLDNIKKGISDNVIAARNEGINPGKANYDDATFIRVLPGLKTAYVAYEGSVQRLTCKKL